MYQIVRFLELTSGAGGTLTLVKSDDIGAETVSFNRRDREILRALCLGGTVKGIADELEVTIGSIYKHQTSICERAGVSRPELPMWALQNPQCLERDGQSKPGLHPPDCPCDSPYCAGMRRRRRVA